MLLCVCHTTIHFLVHCHHDDEHNRKNIHACLTQEITSQNSVYSLAASIARIVTCTRRSEHITPVFARLHWLKIARLIDYEVALLTFKALTTGKPDYLSDQLQLCSPVRQVRSSDRLNHLYLNNYWTTFASLAFHNAVPVVWNNLPHHLTDDRSCPASFRRNLKTHLFSKSFRHWLLWPIRHFDSSIYFWLTYVASPTA